MRTFFWTFPSKFFAHFIRTEDDEQRILLSLGLKQTITEDDFRPEDHSHSLPALPSYTFEPAVESRSPKRKWDDFDDATTATNKFG